MANVIPLWSKFCRAMVFISVVTISLAGVNVNPSARLRFFLAKCPIKSLQAEPYGDLVRFEKLKRD